MEGGGQLLSDSQMDGSYDWREEEDEKVLYKTAKIKDLFPINFNDQREIFFEKKQSYNPHFCYKTIVSPEVIPLHFEYEQLANKILINNKFENPELPVLTQQQVVNIIQSYLENLGLGDYVEIKFQPNCLSRTSISFYKQKAVLKIRMPIQYNKINLQGVLNHEVGTHIIRRLNHKDNCIRKPSQKGKLVEQGLAAINQLLPEERPFLFKAALRYVAAIYASKMSFSNMYKQVNKYIKDKNECWRECVRVKRGLGNTEELGGYYKDQNYLIGAVEILRSRNQIDFKKIFYGKLSADETKNLESGVLPPFIDSEQKYRHYLKKLDAIALCNFID